MNDLYGLLDNRTDLEKLEQDLRLLTGSTVGALDPEILQRIEIAQRELETARAAHIALFFQLYHKDEGQRNTARENLVRRIAAGEQKFYDPQIAAWRNAKDLWIDARKFEEDFNQRENEFRELETALHGMVEAPHRLKALEEIIARVSALEGQHSLTPAGQEALSQARHASEDGQKHHRQLTMMLRTGSLKEQSWAIERLRQFIIEGETDILEAPGHIWRPAGQVLADALQAYQQESARLVDQALRKAADQHKTHPDQELRTLYLALNKAIPYTENDRQRLEKVYFERLAERHTSAISSQLRDSQINAADLEGFKKVAEVYDRRLKVLFNRSADWMNQHRSALTTTVKGLLVQAESEATSVGKTVELIGMAEELARRQLERSIEIPEVLLRGGKILFNKNEARLARDALEKALPLYTLERLENIHRHAVTAWMLGCLEYFQGDRFNGYSHWKVTRSLFTDLLKEANRTRQTENATWYKSRLAEIDKLMVQTFEGVYFGWLNAFNMLHTPNWLAEYRQMMDTQLSSQKHDELRRTITRVLNEAQRDNDLEVLWLSQVEVAFFEYQLHDYQSAIAHLEQASIGFQFEHRSAVTLWLLGMIRWWLPSQRVDGLFNWEESIRRFEKLARDADRRNLQNQRTWYETQIGLMKTSLREWIKLTQV